MVTISKGQEPQSLTEHREAGGNYKGLVKTELRLSLVGEQGRVCCYCLKIIPENGLGMHHTKIEHFKCQDDYTELSLEYNNMHIACKGNQGRKPKFQTCDTRKGNSEIHSFTLLDGSIDNKIEYAKDGTIFSEDEDIDKDINDILNLNEQNLKIARNSVISGLSKRVLALKKKGALKKSTLNKQLAFWSTKQGDSFIEFFAVAVHYLENEIQKID